MPHEHQRVQSDVRLDRPSAGISVVQLIGEHDLATKGQVEDTLDSALASGDNVAVDLTTADFIDSSTLHVLVSASRRATESGRGFSIVLGTNDTIRQVFELTGLLTQLASAPSVADAIGAFENNSA
jgi:anti-anti-sigma factor